MRKNNYLFTIYSENRKNTTLPANSACGNLEKYTICTVIFSHVNALKISITIPPAVSPKNIFNYLTNQFETMTPVAPEQFVWVAVNNKKNTSQTGAVDLYIIKYSDFQDLIEHLESINGKCDFIWPENLWQDIITNHKTEYSSENYNFIKDYEFITSGNYKISPALKIQRFSALKKIAFLVNACNVIILLFMFIILSYNFTNRAESMQNTLTEYDSILNRLQKENNQLVTENELRKKLEEENFNSASPARILGELNRLLPSYMHMQSYIQNGLNLDLRIISKQNDAALYKTLNSSSIFQIINLKKDQDISSENIIYQIKIKVKND